MSKNSHKLKHRQGVLRRTLDLLRDPLAIKAQKRQLDQEVREAFAAFIEGCHWRILNDQTRQVLNKDLKEVAGLLAERQEKQRHSSDKRDKHIADQVKRT
jgi:hypothetical protein